MENEHTITIMIIDKYECNAGGGGNGREWWTATILPLTLEVQITSCSIRFMNILQLTSLPLYVSPFFSSTSIGWPLAVFNSERGSITVICFVPSQGNIIERKADLRDWKQPIRNNITILLLIYWVVFYCPILLLYLFYNIVAFFFDNIIVRRHRRPRKCTNNNIIIILKAESTADQDCRLKLTYPSPDWWLCTLGGTASSILNAF